MKNYDYGHGFKPISAWGYIGYQILWGIPVIGWIIWLCSAIGAKNRNVKNYARAPLCAILLAIIIAVAAAIIGLVLQLVGVVDFVAFYEAFLEAMKNPPAA